MQNDFLMRVVFRYVLLFIQVYTFYVILHGHISPGGGFAGGIVLGLGLVLYALIFGLETGTKRLPLHYALFIIGVGEPLRESSSSCPILPLPLHRMSFSASD